MPVIDARTLPAGTEIEADLIVIGGGMAGIAIAREWAGANRRIAILESGGREIDPEIQSLYDGEGAMRAPGNGDRNIDAYLRQSRARAWGGSGNIWGGKCVPLDPSDFAAREWLPETGWPFTRADLQPFYDRACDMLQIPRFDPDYDPLREEGRPPLRIDGARHFFSAPRVFSRLSGGADAAAFDAFRTEPTNSANVTVYLHANVVEIRRARFRDAVAGLDVACLNGVRHTARGRAYVLATGGIENVRLLLAANGGRGLANDSGLVGACFQGHVTFGVYQDPNGYNTSVCVSDPQSMALYADQARDKVHCVLAASLDGQRRYRTGNFTTTMIASPQPTQAEPNAVLALAGQIDVGAAPANNLLCFFMSEHLPNRDSRISLNPAAVDALGMPRVRLEWTYSERDLASLEASIAALGDELGAAGKGRVCWPVARSQLLGILNQSRHHMGTTRMHVEPEHGVVDADCRAHGLSNFYIAGSSVFPTSGIANPTLTLMALAVRLSDHLKSRLGVVP